MDNRFRMWIRLAVINSSPTHIRPTELNLLVNHESIFSYGLNGVVDKRICLDVAISLEEVKFENQTEVIRIQ